VSDRSQLRIQQVAHRIFILTLFAIGIAAVAWFGYLGFRYYASGQDSINTVTSDLDARASGIDVELELRRQGLGADSRSDMDLLREKAGIEREARYWEDWSPGGFTGHGLGFVGSAMMIAGVALYSTRKRVKRFRFTGKIRYWLEVHIFLCLLGPALVLYHTTFKFGGIVSISAWSMIFVALSGLLGRYIYTQIPKTLEGAEKSLEDLGEEDWKLRDELRSRYGLSPESVDRIDALNTVRTKSLGAGAALLRLLRDDLSRPARTRRLRRHLLASGVSTEHARGVMSVARKKSLLGRRMAFLGTAREIFHYWHVVHFPFAIIMFVILAIHVAVTVSLGYRWLF
jgi:hypothetical protein